MNCQGADYTGTPGFSDLPMALISTYVSTPKSLEICTLRSLLNEQSTLSEQGGIFSKNS